MRAVGYIRVSTTDQARDGYGLDAQHARITQEVERRGWVLERVCRDEGQSGKTLERSGLLEALKVISGGWADVLVVAKLDRMTRSVLDFALLLRWFEQASARLVALDFDLDTGTANGRLMAHILAAMAEWERDLIGQRTREGLAAARAGGVVLGRGGVVDSPELFERIRGLREGGLSLQGIVDRLNAEGVPTVRGGRVWRKSAIQATLGYRRRGQVRVVELPPVRRGRA